MFLEELKKLDEAATDAPLDASIKSLRFIRNHAADIAALVEAAEGMEQLRKDGKGGWAAWDNLRAALSRLNKESK